MKRIMTIAAAFAISASAYANAASTTTTTTTTITPDQETAIDTYVTKHKTTSIEAPSGFTVETGAMLPESVQIEEFPSDVGVTGGYAVIGGQRVIVGSDRKIIRVMK